MFPEKQKQAQCTIILFILNEVFIDFLFPQQSLAGHTSPVESVQFNGNEDLVLAGSQSGTLKIWDLEAAKSKILYCKFIFIYL